MPYIRQNLRPPIDKYLDPLIKDLSASLSLGELSEKDLAGCLTYITFKLIKNFYAEGRWYDKMDAEKVCASAIDEFKRRFLHPYEDSKILSEGDVI
jgi:hypothetical protein